MRYLPLTQPDRDAMLSVIGVGQIDDLFADVPEAARLDGPVRGLPHHASELEELMDERSYEAFVAKL